MNYQKREEIFSKEALSIRDVMDLIDCSYDRAAKLIVEWKRKLEFDSQKLHLSMEGKIHVLDYFAAMGIDPKEPGDRYFKKRERPAPAELHLNAAAARSVCH